MRPIASIARMISPPEVEPVSLSQAKAHLRVDGGDEDALIGMCITAARERVEQETRRALIRQRWVASITGPFGGCSPVELPRPRLIEGEEFSLEYRDAAGNWLAYSSPLVQAIREPALVWAQAPVASLGSPISEQDAVWRATYWCGYGTDPESVPGPLRHAVLLLTAHLYERREMVISGTIISEVPRSLDWLVAPYRAPWEGAQ